MLRTSLLFLVAVAMFQSTPALSKVTPADPRLATIGELIPDLKLVDDRGIPTKLRQLTLGHYTVMTLGCLT